MGSSEKPNIIKLKVMEMQPLKARVPPPLVTDTQKSMMEVSNVDSIPRMSQDGISTLRVRHGSPII